MSMLLHTARYAREDPPPLSRLVPVKTWSMAEKLEVVWIVLTRNSQ